MEESNVNSNHMDCNNIPCIFKTFEKTQEETTYIAPNEEMENDDIGQDLMAYANSINYAGASGHMSNTLLESYTCEEEKHQQLFYHSLCKETSNVKKEFKVSAKQNKNWRRTNKTASTTQIDGKKNESGNEKNTNNSLYSTSTQKKRRGKTRKQSQTDAEKNFSEDTGLTGMIIRQNNLGTDTSNQFVMNGVKQYQRKVERNESWGNIKKKKNIRRKGVGTECVNKDNEYCQELIDEASLYKFFTSIYSKIPGKKDEKIYMQRNNGTTNEHSEVTKPIIKLHDIISYLKEKIKECCVNNNQTQEDTYYQNGNNGQGKRKRKTTSRKRKTNQSDPMESANIKTINNNVDTTIDKEKIERAYKLVNYLKRNTDNTLPLNDTSKIKNTAFDVEKKINEHTYANAMESLISNMNNKKKIKKENFQRTTSSTTSNSYANDTVRNNIIRMLNDHYGNIFNMCKSNEKITSINENKQNIESQPEIMHHKNSSSNHVVNINTNIFNNLPSNIKNYLYHQFIRNYKEMNEMENRNSSEINNCGTYRIKKENSIKQMENLWDTKEENEQNTRQIDYTDMINFIKSYYAHIKESETKNMPCSRNTNLNAFKDNNLNMNSCFSNPPQSTVQTTQWMNLSPDILKAYLERNAKRINGFNVKCEKEEETKKNLSCVNNVAMKEETTYFEQNVKNYNSEHFVNKYKEQSEVNNSTPTTQLRIINNVLDTNNVLDGNENNTGCYNGTDINMIYRKLLFLLNNPNILNILKKKLNSSGDSECNEKKENANNNDFVYNSLNIKNNFDECNKNNINCVNTFRQQYNTIKPEDNSKSQMLTENGNNIYYQLMRIIEWTKKNNTSVEKTTATSCSVTDKKYRISDIKSDAEVYNIENEEKLNKIFLQYYNYLKLKNYTIPSSISWPSSTTQSNDFNVTCSKKNQNNVNKTMKFANNGNKVENDTNIFHSEKTYQNDDYNRFMCVHHKNEQIKKAISLFNNVVHKGNNNTNASNIHNCIARNENLENFCHNSFFQYLKNEIGNLSKEEVSRLSPCQHCYIFKKLENRMTPLDVIIDSQRLYRESVESFENEGWIKHVSKYEEQKTQANTESNMNVQARPAEQMRNILQSYKCYNCLKKCKCAAHCIECIHAKNMEVNTNIENKDNVKRSVMTSCMSSYSKESFDERKNDTVSTLNERNNDINYSNNTLFGNEMGCIQTPSEIEKKTQPFDLDKHIISLASINTFSLKQKAEIEQETDDEKNNVKNDDIKEMIHEMKSKKDNIYFYQNNIKQEQEETIDTNHSLEIGDNRNEFHPKHNNNISLKENKNEFEIKMHNKKSNNEEKSTIKNTNIVSIDHYPDAEALELNNVCTKVTNNLKKRRGKKLQQNILKLQKVELKNTLSKKKLTTVTKENEITEKATCEDKNIKLINEKKKTNTTESDVNNKNINIFIAKIENKQLLKCLGDNEKSSKLLIKEIGKNKKNGKKGGSIYTRMSKRLKNSTIATANNANMKKWNNHTFSKKYNRQR